MKRILIFALNLFWISIFSQKDIIHSFERVSNDEFHVSFKSMEDEKAIIFTVANYTEDNEGSIESILTKVDYCGDIEVIAKVSIQGFSNIMLFDGVKNNNTYTLVGTALSLENGLSYLITVSASLDLSLFEVIDRREVKYLFVTNTDHNSTKDLNSNVNYLIFNLSDFYIGAKEVNFLSYSNNGEIKYFSALNLKDIYITEYYYNPYIQKHFIMSGSLMTVLNHQFEIINTYDIYVDLDDKRKYNIEYKILYADSDKAVLVGRWGSIRSLYRYTIGFNGNEFVPGDYRTDIFPQIKSYQLRKKINQNNKIILSVSTDEFDTPREIPNTNYFWEMDTLGNIFKTYQITDNYKKNIRISHIDPNGIMLGVGYEYIPERNIFVILDEESGFAVGSEDIQTDQHKFAIFPNPASDFINLPKKNSGSQIQIFNILGQQVFEAKMEGDHERQIDISQLPVGQYHAIIFDGKIKHKAKFVKM